MIATDGADPAAAAEDVAGEVTAETTVTITIDPTIPGALGSFGYDDEGTPAQRVDIVRDGIWVGVLSGRDSASIAGLPPGGMVRADGYDRMPMVRMRRSRGSALAPTSSDMRPEATMRVSSIWNKRS